MFLLASQIFCNIATDTGIPGMCLCYNNLSIPQKRRLDGGKWVFATANSSVGCWHGVENRECGEWTHKASARGGKGDETRVLQTMDLLNEEVMAQGAMRAAKKRHLATWSSLWMCILCKLTCGFWNGWGAFSTKNSAFRINSTRRKMTSTRKTYLWRRPHQRRETK